MGQSFDPTVGERHHVLCSWCGNEWIHPMSVDVRPTQSDPGRQEVDYAITWVCEEGHSFVEKVEFHEGLTFRRLLSLKSTHADEASS